MKNFTVHIALSDRGWVLENLARKLSDSLPYVTYDEDTDPNADIQYYMTYGVWKAPIARKEIAYFAHIEQDIETRNKFFNVARNVDFCICHSQPYEKELRENGIDYVRTISPGVDLRSFTPKVKIGVVGRTYHTGRKGEAIVAQLMDIPGVEWHFTGSGWPGPALNLRDDEMPAFYNAMDYILVPSLYEGGPMSVVEALACGCEVIAPPIGWVPEFPHIEYRTGDPEDLRRVINEVVEKRTALRESVLDRSWEGWIKGHDEVFTQIGADLGGGLKSRPVQVIKPPMTRSVQKPALMLHGTERSKDKGGPSVRAPKTALRLERLGYEVKVHNDLMFDQRQHDLYHIFNLWSPKSCRRTMEFIQLSGSPVVLSPIYLDLSEKRTFDSDVAAVFRRAFSWEATNDEFARLREKRKRQLEADLPAFGEPYSGFFHEVRKLVETADHLICLSEHERDALRAIGADVSRSTVIQNPVDCSLYAKSSPELFQKTFGVSDYVLCVGRIEPRKNQIMLLHALKEAGLPIVLIGHASSPEYEQLLRSVAGPNVLFAGRIAPNSELLASAYAGARVFCLPSWSEGAPLVALEAAAAGCRMVLSDRSSEREYFGERADYIDPANPEEILKVIRNAYDTPFSPRQREDFKSWVSETYNWDRHIERTAAVYESVAAERKKTKKPTNAKRKVFIDLTSSAHRSGPPSGIARVEERYAQELYTLMPDRVQFVVWNSDRRKFLAVSYDQFMSGKHKSLCGANAPSYLFDERDFQPSGRVKFEEDAVLLVLGGAWIRNENYIQCLVNTKRDNNLMLAAFVHDVIQSKFKQWFPDKVGEEFAANCHLLVEAADHMIVNSQCTLQDLREFCLEQELVPPPIDTVRFGDQIDNPADPLQEPQFDRLLPILKGKPFILCVSAIDIRKNHIQLYNIWERMLAEYGDKTPHLIMVGSKGWSIDPFLQMVSRNKSIQQVFHVMNGINDASLDWLYRNCLFTVYPSLYEGWGLPVAESLNYGKICVAARAGSVPEIAPSFTDLLDPMDFPSWYRTIVGYAFNRSSRVAREATISKYKPVSWQASAETLLDLLQNLGSRRRPSPDLRVGQTLLFDNGSLEGGNSKVFRVGGWYPAEQRGCWTAGTVAKLRFQLSGDQDKRLLLQFKGSGFQPANHPPQSFEVYINGSKAGELVWSGTNARDLIVLSSELSRDLLCSREDLVELRIRQPLIPATISSSSDKRLLGLMVNSMQFRPCDVIPLDVWLDPADIATQDMSYAPIVGHGLEGGISLKIPLSLNAGEEAVPQDEVVYFGLRYAFRNDKAGADEAVSMQLSVGKEWLCAIEGKAGRLEDRIVPIPRAYLVEGCILHITPLGMIDLSALEIVEYGVFSSACREIVPHLPLDNAVTFGSSGNPQLDPSLPKPDQRYLVSGWSWPELDGIWSDGRSAHIIFQTSLPASEPAILQLEGMPMEGCLVEVSVNKDQPIRLDFSSGWKPRRPVLLSGSALRDGLAHVTLRFEAPVSPLNVSESTDHRLLGLKLSSMTLSSLEAVFEAIGAALMPLPVNRIATFNSAVTERTEELDGYGLMAYAAIPPEAIGAGLISGWSPIEPEGVWLEGYYGLIAIKIDPTLEAAELSFALKTYRGTTIDISVSGRRRTSWAAEPLQTIWCTVPLMKEDVQRGAILVSIGCDLAVSPSEVQPGGDPRKLGVFLSSIAVLDSTRPIDSVEFVPAETSPETELGTRSDYEPEDIQDAVEQTV